MKVSLSRKIHIMAFPQETFLNARWSEDQSATMPPASLRRRVAECCRLVRQLLRFYVSHLPSDSLYVDAAAARTSTSQTTSRKCQ